MQNARVDTGDGGDGVIETPDSVDMVTFSASGLGLQVFLREGERAYLTAVLAQANGNKRTAAQLAGISYSTFRAKLATYRIHISIDLT